MNINKHNYESWFLDYHEGTLSAEKTAELFLFLEQHPALKEEFESFEIVSLENETAPEFPAKQSLKKLNFPSEENIDEWLVAELEGDLNLQQRIHLKEFISLHPSYQRDREIYLKTKLTADKSEIFPDKSSLRKRVAGYTFSQAGGWHAIAASILLLIGAYFAFNSIREGDKRHSAGNNRNIETSVQIRSTTPAPVNNSQTAEQKKTIQQKENSVVSPAESGYAQQKHEKNKPATEKNDLQFANQQPLNNTPVIIPADKIILQDNITLMEPLPLKPLTESDPFVFAERKYDPGNSLQNVQGNDNATTAPQKKVLDDLKNFAAKNINKVTGQDMLATAKSTPKLPLKSRMIRFATSLVGKITNDHVKVRTTFDPLDGNIAAYELEMGKTKWQKQF